MRTKKCDEFFHTVVTKINIRKNQETKHQKSINEREPEKYNKNCLIQSDIICTCALSLNSCKYFKFHPYIFEHITTTMKLIL